MVADALFLDGVLNFASRNERPRGDVEHGESNLHAPQE